MRNANINNQQAIRQAAQHFGRKHYTLRCYHLNEQVFTYDILADNREQAVQSCLADNPQDAANPYFIGQVTLHIPILGH